MHASRRARLLLGAVLAATSSASLALADPEGASAGKRCTPNCLVAGACHPSCKDGVWTKGDGDDDCSEDCLKLGCETALCEDLSESEWNWKLNRERRARALFLSDSNPLLDPAGEDASGTGVLALDGVLHFENSPTPTNQGRGRTAYESLLAGHVALESQNATLGARTSIIATHAGFTALRLYGDPGSGWQLGAAVEQWTQRLILEADTENTNLRFDGGFFANADGSSLRTVATFSLELNEDQIDGSEGSAVNRDGNFESYGVELRNYSDSYFLRPDDELTFRGGVVRRSEPTDGSDARFRGTTAYIDAWLPLGTPSGPQDRAPWVVRGSAGFTWGEFTASDRSDRYQVLQASVSKYFGHGDWEIVGGASWEKQDPGIAGAEWDRTTVWAGFGFGKRRTRATEGTVLSDKSVPLSGSSSGPTSGAGPQPPRI